MPVWKPLPIWNLYLTFLLSPPFSEPYHPQCWSRPALMEIYRFKCICNHINCVHFVGQISPVLLRNQSLSPVLESARLSTSSFAPDLLPAHRLRARPSQYANPRVALFEIMSTSTFDLYTCWRSKGIGSSR